MTDLKNTVKEERARVEKEFKELKEKREALVEQGKQLQTQLNQIDAELIRLQGDFRSYDKLLSKSETKVEKKEKKEK